MTRKSLLFIGLTLALSTWSCGQQDRTVRVVCAETGFSKAFVSLPNPTGPGNVFGFLRSRSLRPGSLIELEPASSASQLGTARVLRSQELSTADLSPPASMNIDESPSYVGFGVEADSEVEGAAKAGSIDLNGLIAKITRLWMEDVEIQSLRNPLQFINTNGNLRNMVAADTGEIKRYALVSSVMRAGKFAFYLTNESSPFLGVGVVRMGDYYLHVSYSCADSNAADIGEMTLFSYLPVRYDSSRQRIVMDPRMLELTSYSLVYE